MGRRSSRGNGSRSRTSSDAAGGEQITAAGVLDRFTSVDDLIRELDASVRRMNDNLVSLNEGLDEQTDLEIDVTPTARNEFPFDLSTEVPEGTDENNPVESDLNIPKDGTLVRTILGWPEGAQQAVGIGIKGVDGERLIPRGPPGTRYIGLNDKVITFDQDYSVKKGETLTVQYANNDPEEPHFANAILVIAEE